MSENKIVKETKLYKYNIESPTIAAEDIILSGIHLNSKLFGGEVIPTRLDTFQLLLMSGGTVGSRSAEQIIGFTLDVDDSKRGDKIRSVTVKRIDTSGNATALSNEVYMYIDMIDSNNAVISTFFSDLAKQQTRNDISIGDIKQNTWTFSDEVTIPTRCVRVDFRFSTVKNQRQTNCSIRTHSWRLVNNNSNRLYVLGYKTIWPGNTYESYTSLVYIDFDVIVTGLQSHSKDSTLHLSPEKDLKIASIDLLQETIDGHIVDEDRHITVVEKEQISLNTNNIAFLSSNVAAIQTSLQATVKTKSTLRLGLVAHIEGRLGAKCIQLSKLHFLLDYSDKKISEIHIPYYNSGTGDANKIAKLCVQFFSQEEEIIGKLVYSLNEVKQSTIGGTPESNFYFDNLTIPDDFRYVRLCFVPNDTVIPNGATCENCVEYRIRILSPSDNQKLFDDFDTDDCVVYIGSGNTSNYVGYVKVVTIHSVLDKLVELDELPRCIDHVDDDGIHVTAEDKERWNNLSTPDIVIPDPITYTAGDGIDISDNTISVITTDVIEESDKIPTAKALYNTFYGTRTFNNYDTSKYTHLADTVGTIVLSKKHFISGGKITKVLVPHGNTQEDLTNGQGGFLVIDVFKEDNSFSDGYDKNNPTYRYWADDYYAYKNRLNEGHYEWTFNKRDCIIPDDYKVVHLSLVVDEANVNNVGVTSSSNAQFRINCLAKNGNRDEGVVYEEDDECRVYWQGGANGENRVAIVQVEYIGNKLDDFSIVPMLLERISALEARVSELENS